MRSPYLFLPAGSISIPRESSSSGTSGLQRRGAQWSLLTDLHSNRTKIMRELAETLKTLITLERQAYNLDEQEHDEPYEERLRRLLGE